MAGRKATFPKEQLLPYLILEKHNILTEDGVVAVGDKVWTRLATAIAHIHVASPSYLRMIIATNRYELLSSLGVEVKHTIDNKPVHYEEDTKEEWQEEEPGSDDVLTSFNITLSPEEWCQISPIELTYTKNTAKGPRDIAYKALRPRVWTNVINDHFYLHTRSPCRMTYKGGKIGQGMPFAQFEGKCDTCKSVFKGEILFEPISGEKVLIKCTLQGDFRSQHQGRKRYLTGSARAEYAEKVVQQKMAPSAVHRLAAESIMRQGEQEPAHLPSNSVLRNLKCEQKKKQRLDDDPMTAVLLLKYRPVFNNFIKDITVDKVNIPFWSTAQVHAERRYITETSLPSLSIDSTGSIVRRVVKVDGNKSGHIFLTEVVVRDEVKNMHYAVASLLSERGDSETYRHFLQLFLRDGALVPKQVVLDMSVSLITACLQAFAGFQSIGEYLQECAKIIANEDPLLPSCFIRNDVAHTVKLLASLPSLKQRGGFKRTREFYLRCLAQLLQCTDIKDARVLIKHIFTVAMSETKGVNPESGEDTPSTISRAYLQNRIGTGVVVTEEELLYDDEEDEDKSRVEFHRQFIAQSRSESVLGKKKDFLSWSEDIKDEVLENNIEGDDDNTLFLPDLVKDLKNLMTTLPLWTAVMVPYYGYGGPSASSAVSERNFGVVKRTLSGHLNLPARPEEFLANYILCLSGYMKLEASLSLTNLKNPHEVSDVGDNKSSGSLATTDKDSNTVSLDIGEKKSSVSLGTADENSNTVSLDGLFNRISDVFRNQSATKINISKNGEYTNNVTHSSVKLTFSHDEMDVKMGVRLEEGFIDNSEVSEMLKEKSEGNPNGTEDVKVDVLHDNSNEIWTDAVETKVISGNALCHNCNTFLTPELATKCVICNVSIHVSSNCSTTFSSPDLSIRGHVCKLCAAMPGQEYVTLNDINAVDSWKGQKPGTPPPTKKKSTYLDPKAEWNSINLDAKASLVTIPVLKNGNSTNLQPIKIGKEVLCLQNTCAFDSLLQLFACAFVDSDEYKKFLKDHGNWELSALITQMCNKRLTVGVYNQRARILSRGFPKKTGLGRVTVVKCETNVSQMAQYLAETVPSLLVVNNCSSPDCPLKERIMRDAVIGVGLKGSLDSLSECVGRVTNMSSSSCLEKMPQDYQGHLYLKDPSLSDAPMCSGERTQSATLSSGHLLIEIVQDNEARLAECQVKLEDLPVVIGVENRIYMLRGAVGFRGSSTFRRGEVGHYVAYTRRLPGTWEEYDDLQDKAKPCARSRLIRCHLVLYTL